MHDNIRSLYERYGFKHNPSASTPKLLVHTIKAGYVHHADVLVLDPSEREGVAKTRSNLEESGFSCLLRDFTSLEALEDRLFSGFFGTAETRQRHLKHYADFTTNTSRNIDGPYEYIAARFSQNGQEQHGKGIVETVVDAFTATGPTIVLLEAAAGYGKTCTAYEVLNTLVARRPERPPLFIELARNRQATIFQYVLLDEIDRNYPGLNRELVESEIATGNVPLIIDGFDELLRRSAVEPAEDTANRVETMLDTVAMLLRGQAKILITTRRTAFFSDADFDTWCDQYEGRFRAERLVLHAPTPQDWVGSTRARRIEELGSAAQALANPVLLSMLRHLDDTSFRAYISDTDLMVDRYFERITERELVRQDINIPHDEQLAILRRLASHFIQEDVTTESEHRTAEVIRTTSRDILEHSQAKYSSGNRPSLEQLSEKLTRHALLDRVGQEGDKIGFVNEFVAGTLFGEVLEKTSNAFCSERVLDLSTFAYSARGSERRGGLFEAVRSMLPALTTLERTTTALRLLNDVDFDITNDTIEGISFHNCVLGKHSITNSVFNNCVFKSVTFLGDRITQCGFGQCRFYDCKTEGAADGLWHRNCSSTPDENFLDHFGQMVGAIDPPTDKIEDDVLRQFWPKGRSFASSRLSKRTIYRGFSPGQRQHIDDALETLRGLGLIRLDSDVVHLNTTKMSDVRGRIGR
jgi:hypothetical protein